MIQNKKLTSYLLYAFGEILLVMVGILLALQVNNWNEYRKDRQKEQNILQELEESISANLETLTRSQKMIEQHQVSANIIKEYISEKRLYSDTLNRHMNRALPIGLVIIGKISQSGYKALENTGYDILLDEQLREKVVALFETTIPTIISVNEEFAEWYRIFLPDSFQKFLQLKNSEISPLENVTLSDEPYFISMLEYRIMQKNWAHRMVSDGIAEMEEVLELIEKNKRN
jgi:hypothetical protein